MQIQPSLRLAARPSQTADPLPSSTDLVARAGAGLFAGGMALSFLVALLPHPAQIDQLGFFAVGTAAGAVAVLMRWQAGRLPRWALFALLCFGTLLITGDIYFSGEGRGAPSAANEMVYLWAALYAGYFFSRRQAAFQIAWIGVCYGAVLALTAPPSIFATRWLETVGTLAVSAVLIFYLRNRIGELLGRLADAAWTDSLTGLQNRRGFEELIGVEIERARRSERQMSLMVGDLDHFKLVNDRLGHGAGDAALTRVGAILTKGKRRIDTAARTGGEEFALLLPEATQHEAFQVAERLRWMVQTEFAETVAPLTVSFGVVAFPDNGKTAESLLEAGERALYAAKELGRNRSVLFSSEVEAIVSVRPASGDRGEVHLATLLALAEALDFRDAGTADHSQTVGRHAQLIARALRLTPARVERIRLAGILHDIGKVGLSDLVLQKPGPLDPTERAQIEKHPEMGAQILSSSGFEDIRAWVLAHHERPDGRGYPFALSGEEIPLEARILAVADAYEAMTADRIYRPAIGPEAARAELRRHAGRQFDSAIVDAFLQAMEHAAAGTVPAAAVPEVKH